MRRISSFTEFKQAELELIKLNDKLGELKEEITIRAETIPLCDRLKDPREEELANEIEKTEKAAILTYLRMGKFLPENVVSEEFKRSQEVTIELEDEKYTLSELDDYIWRD